MKKFFLITIACLSGISCGQTNKETMALSNLDFKLSKEQIYRYLTFYPVKEENLSTSAPARKKQSQYFTGEWHWDTGPYVLTDSEKKDSLNRGLIYYWGDTLPPKYWVDLTIKQVGNSVSGTYYVYFAFWHFDEGEFNGTVKNGIANITFNNLNVRGTATLRLLTINSLEWKIISEEKIEGDFPFYQNMPEKIILNKEKEDEDKK